MEVDIQRVEREVGEGLPSLLHSKHSKSPTFRSLGNVPLSDDSIPPDVQQFSLATPPPTPGPSAARARSPSINAMYDEMFGDKERALAQKDAEITRLKD